MIFNNHSNLEGQHAFLGASKYHLKKRYEQKIDAVAAMMDAYIAYKLNRDAFE